MRYTKVFGQSQLFSNVRINAHILQTIKEFDKNIGYCKKALSENYNP